ncbi:MAG: NAD(P)H-dependent oxidoreductase subunit E [Elusimicrobiota bacterium]
MNAKAPVKSPFTDEQEKVLLGWTKKFPYSNLGLIEALRSVQDWHRMITPEAASHVADLFSLPFNHVWGVATFFPTFTRWKTGQKRVGVCHGLSCFLKGSGKAEKCLEKTLGVPKKQATADGKFSWETMECLGACEQAPAFQVNDRLVGPATEEAIMKLKDAK